MDVEQGRRVVEQYRSLLCFMPKGEGPFDDGPTSREAMSHIHGMLDKMDALLNSAEVEFKHGTEGKPGWDKFNRWLGFMQGVFWLHGDYTLNMMRGHNRSEKRVWVG